MTYTITEDGVLTLSGKLPEKMDVTIRAKAPFRHVVIEDGITFIGSHNFYGMEEIEELTLPPSVRTIGARAFDGCKNLTRIHFSEGLTTIGKYAFWECTGLSRMTLPDSLQKIGDCAFFGCSSLKRIKIPKNMKTLGYSAFKACDGLTQVVLPNGLQRIETEAFRWCRALESVFIPRSVSYIGQNAFDCCDKLKDVILPNDKISLGYNAFGEDECCSVIGEDSNEYDCYISHYRTNRSTVAISSANGKAIKGDLIVPGTVCHEGKTYTVTEILESAFCDSEGLTSVQLPDSIRVIQDYAFRDCPNLKVVKCGESLRTIGSQAFSDCHRLESIVWGTSLQYIGMDAFAGCGKLRELFLPDSLEALGCHALEDTPVLENRKGVVYIDRVLCGYNGYLPPHSYLEIREGTTLIAERAFTGRRNLEGVIFANSVRRIGYCSFDECDSLKFIKLPKSLVDIGDNAFNYSPIQEVVAPWKKPISLDHDPFPKQALIHIPKGSAEAYSKADHWNKHKLIEM